jgi:hypothetical protein
MRATRREFLQHGVLAAAIVPLLTAMGPFVHVGRRQEYDLVVRGVVVVRDGQHPATPGNVLRAQ